MSIRDELETEILIAMEKSVLAEIQDAFPEVPVRVAVAMMAKFGVQTWKTLKERTKRRERFQVHDRMYGD